MRVTFFGATQEVTGSCYLVEAAGHRLLVDCGIFQGIKLADARNRHAFPFRPERIEALLLTHSHSDHGGRIPKLVHDGFRGKVFATAPTVELTELLWKDHLDIMSYERRKHGHPMLFESGDVARASTRFSAIGYRERREVLPGVFATWFDAGHILGSAFILIEADGKRIVFSGDQGNAGEDIMHPTEPMPPADAVVCEATYGGELHEDPKTRRSLLIEAFERTVGAGGVLMIPAFAIERTQELLHDLCTLVRAGNLPQVPVYLDSPLAIDALAVYRKYGKMLRHETASMKACGGELFAFPGLKLTRTREESKAINSVPAPKVVIAGSGMMNGGRIQHHLIRYLSDPNSEVLVIGYQAQGTPGRHILDGDREVEVLDQWVRVRARVKAIGAYSAHADKMKLLAWIAGERDSLHQVMITHSEAPVAESFVRTVRERLSLKAMAPTFGESVAID